MEKKIRIHRVGSLTAGVSMVAMGVMFILHTFLHILSYDMIFRLWPFILIGLGVEILLSNLLYKRFVYDKAAVFLLIMLTFFAVGMAGVDVLFENYKYCRYIF